MMDRIIHPFPPVYAADSRILILGSFPSVKSREGEFYYHHPQNRFWKVISGLTGEQLPVTIPQKKELILHNRIAIWDVIQSCEITGSADSSIRNVIPNDIIGLLRETQIDKIYANGDTAFRLFLKHIKSVTDSDIIKLPSTSPANAACTLEILISRWSCIKEALN